MWENNVTNFILSESSFYFRNFYLIHFVLLLAPIVILFWGSQRVELQTQTALLTLIIYPIYSLAMTVGYHRLWSHRSYHACASLRYILAVLGAGQFQWSIIWWVRHHRAHHRYLDSDKDPYNARRGLFYSHIGWLIGFTPATWGPVDIADVECDPVAVWQQRYYAILAPFAGLMVPTYLAQLICEDWQGGLLYAGLFRSYIHAHMTFLVNSVAHWSGSQPYSTSHTARDNFFLGLLTSGEGYHNFHHRFPSDYRNGVHWYAFDLSKWVIWMCERLCLVSRLTRTPQVHIERARNYSVLGDASTVPQNRDYQLDRDRQCNMAWADYLEKTRAGCCLVCISGMVYDVTDFLYSHPGGQDLLYHAIGKDATSLFESFPHSGYARTLLPSLQIAVIAIDNDTY